MGWFQSKAKSGRKIDAKACQFENKKTNKLEFSDLVVIINFNILENAQAKYDWGRNFKTWRKWPWRKYEENVGCASNW